MNRPPALAILAANDVVDACHQPEHGRQRMGLAVALSVCTTADLVELVLALGCLADPASAHYRRAVERARMAAHPGDN